MIMYPKPAKTRKQAQSARRRALEARDTAESVKVHERSGGRCELTVLGWRCTRRATEVHHLIGGSGRRGVGLSALASHKIHLCGTDHAWCHAHGRLLAFDDADPFGTLSVAEFPTG